MMLKILFPLFAFLALLSLASASERIAATELATSATAFLELLEESQTSKATFPFESENRTDWHFFPKNRRGLSLRDLDETQTKLLWKFLEAALSESGIEKTRGVIEAERILWEQSNRSDYRDPGKYHIVFFGNPTPEQTWGASFEGHHLSINLTVVDGKEVFVTPSFFGASPDRISEDNHPLEDEIVSALALLNSLDKKQLAIVRKDSRPTEIRTRALPKVEPMQPEGLPASEMTGEQQGLLMDLIKAYVGRYREAFAEDDLKKIEAAGIGNIHFFWLGGNAIGEPIYYRVQGPSFVMEYANFQNGANHSHTVWRDFENDFGYDALRHHLETEH